MSKRKTHEEFINEINNINPNITILGRYVQSHHKIQYQCNICGYINESTSAHLLNKRGCPKCAKERVVAFHTKPHSKFISEIKKKNTKVKIVGKYINQNTKVQCQCVHCDNVWYALPNNLLKGQGCPQCYGKFAKTHKQFVAEMKQINPNIKVVGKYINNATKIKCRCLKCNQEWYVTPAHLISNTGCPYCRHSKGEDVILHFLNKHKISFISQYKFDDCKHKRPLPFDFYLPDHHMCIEYDGEQHFEPVRFKGMTEEQTLINFKAQQHKDEIKNRYCQDNKIKLVRIPYWDYDKIENILNELFSPTTTE